MADEIIKAEAGIVLPEGVADNVVNIGIAREPQKKSFIETDLYAANVLMEMGGMLVNALQGDTFSAYFTNLCKSDDNNCVSFIETDAKGRIKIKINHNFWIVPYNQLVGCSEKYGFKYDLIIDPNKSRIKINPELEDCIFCEGYKSYIIETFLQKLEQRAAQYKTKDAETALQLFDDFCTIPERLSSVLIPIKENHDRIQKAAEEHFKKLQDLEARLLR